jgi:hypothetical protein
VDVLVGRNCDATQYNDLVEDVEGCQSFRINDGATGSESDIGNEAHRNLNPILERYDHVHLVGYAIHRHDCAFTVPQFVAYCISPHSKVRHAQNLWYVSLDLIPCCTTTLHFSSFDVQNRSTF